MTMQVKYLIVCAVTATVGVGQAQYMMESQAALNMSNTMNSNMPAPGMVSGMGNPGMGFNPNPMGGNTMPGMGGDPTMMGMGIDAGMDPNMMGGQQGMQMMPQATPIPTENVLTGRRVYDAVSGSLLEDPVEIAVRQSDLEKFADDGISDNGIAGDGIRGNVQTFRGQYVGAFSNIMKNQLIHAVHNAEQIDPMVYFGYYVAQTSGDASEGLKRYGLPLPGEEDDVAVNVERGLPSVMDLEADRDELVRRWNHEFLAQYRTTPEDPQSEFYPVFVPSPPFTPVNYPVPTGYVSPQAAGKQTIATQDAAQQQQAAEAASQRMQSRGSGGGMNPGGV